MTDTNFFDSHEALPKGDENVVVSHNIWNEEDLTFSAVLGAIGEDQA